MINSNQNENIDKNNDCCTFEFDGQNRAMTRSLSSLINNIVQDEDNEGNDSSHSEPNTVESHVLEKDSNELLNTGIISKVIWLVGEDGDGISGVT